MTSRVAVGATSQPWPPRGERNVDLSGAHLEP